MIQAQLILGGARSGKSRHALNVAEAIGKRPVFIATAEALDAEMSDRIARHRDERSSVWSTIEAPNDVIAAIENAAQIGDVCLVDCLTLWLSNLMHHGFDVDQEIARLCDRLEHPPISTILVSNEVGLGLVPETPLGRAFRDHQGRLNQAVAATCQRVEFIAAGLSLTLKG